MLDLDAAVDDELLRFLDFLDVIVFEDAAGPFLADVFEVFESCEAGDEDADVVRDEVGELLDALELVAELCGRC